MEKLQLVAQIILITIICYPLSTLIHELGHIVCGLLHHWQLYMLVVGPFKVYRETPEAKIKFALEKNVVMWFGVGGTLPVTESDENMNTWGKILLSGPLASIITGTVALILRVYIIKKSWFLLMFSLVSLAIGVMCLLPSKMKTGFLYNDGTRYKRLKNGGKEGDEERAIFKLIEMTCTNSEINHYPADMIAALINSDDYEMNYYGYYYNYYNAAQKQDKEEMAVQLSNMEKIRDKTSRIVVDDCKIEPQSE